MIKKMSSWIKLFRDINKHWIWQNSDYLKWWLDILLEVNHAPAKVVINNKIYDCNRGEKLYSLDTWAVRWGTNKSKVRRFLQLLQNDNMIKLKSETQTTRLTVCKYDTYQDTLHADETQMKHIRHADETHLTPIEEGKEEIEEKEELNTINFDKLLLFLNSLTKRNFKIINEATKKKYLARLKEGYTNNDIANAMKNAVNSDYHKENNFTYLTPEFFSRAVTLDKYSNVNNKQKEKNVNKSLIPKGVSFSGPQY